MFGLQKIALWQTFFIKWYFYNHVVFCSGFIWCSLNHAVIYLFNVNNKNTRTRCKICTKLTIKVPEPCRWLLVIVSWLLNLNTFPLFRCFHYYYKCRSSVLLVSIYWCITKCLCKLRLVYSWISFFLLELEENWRPYYAYRGLPKFF